MEADSVIIDLSKNSKDEAYNGSMNVMGNSVAMVMIDKDKLVDLNTRQSYGEIKTIEAKAKTTGRAWKLYAIDDFEFKGLRFPISGFPNGDQDQPGRTTLQMEFNEKGVKYCKYDTVLQVHSDEDEPSSEVPF